MYGVSRRVAFKPRADYRLIVAEMAPEPIVRASRSDQPPVDPAEFFGDLAAEPIELLVDADNAFADELDLVHETIGDHVEVTAGLRGAPQDLGSRRAAESLRRSPGISARSSDFIPEALAAISARSSPVISDLSSDLSSAKRRSR